MSHEVFDALKNGQVAIVETDTVYGLAALPGSVGYRDIFTLKGRPAGQVLPWLVPNVSALDTLACDVPEYARNLAEMFWPGALTLVLRASKRACELGGVADDGTLALRCPDAPHLVQLLMDLASPLACTSANVHGCPPATRREELPSSMRALAGFDELGTIASTGYASTIVECTDVMPRILRQGPISEQVVLNVAFYGATLI